MKKLLFIAAIATMVLQSCEKPNGKDPANVSQETKQALVSKYPDATNVVWRAKNNYMVATFVNSPIRSSAQGDLDAWFDNKGAWYMTETDIPFNTLPTAVKTGFSQSIYAQWRVDDVDKIERSGIETVYVIEVEQDRKEMDLYFSEDGILIKEMADMNDDYDYEDYIPSGQSELIEKYIKKEHPQARILEIEREGKYVEVEILDGRVKRELLFDNNSIWLCTKTEVNKSAVPVGVMTTLTESKYGSYRIDDIDHYITPQSVYYRFDLKSGSGDVTVEITTDLVLTVVNNDDDDDNYGGTINQICIDFIAKKYVGAKILESDYDNGYLEVEILHEGCKKDVRFNAANVWVDTNMDISYSELPSAVKSTITASAYAQYEIDDVEFVQTPSNEYYRVELEGRDKDVIMRIKADGTLL